MIAKIDDAPTKIGEVIVNIDNLLVGLKQVRPYASQFDNINSVLAGKQADLVRLDARIASAKAELISIEATRDKALADISASKAELAVLQGGLAQAHKDHDALTRLKKGS